MFTIPSGRCRQLLPNLWLGGLRALAVATLCIYALTVVGTAPPAQAVDFSDGDLRLSLDTTLSHGLSFRVEEPHENIGHYTLVNNNDGNLNYDTGLVSNTSKFTTDFDIGYRNVGAFVRLNGFIDFENENGERARTPLSDEAKDRVGTVLEVLDAYVTGIIEIGETAIDLRLGRHVLNWGESTFIPSGISAFNRFDVSKLRLPGSELREALAPVTMASVAIARSYTLSMEAFYQFDWEETIIDPSGSYFSASDYVGPGAREAVIPFPTLEKFGSAADLGVGFGHLTPDLNADLARYQILHPQLGPVALPQPSQPDVDPDFLAIMRGPDRKPDESGQGGVALRYFAEGLNDTEFGFYFVNYHNRLPVLGARTGTPAGLQAGLAAFGAVAAPTSTTAGALAKEVTSKVMDGVQAGVISPADARTIIEDRVGEQVAGIAASLAVDRYAKTGHYFVEYPEDNQLVGVSFNTLLGASGWALQGEYTMHLDTPLQRAERTLISAGVQPMLQAIGLAVEAATKGAAAQLAAAAARSEPLAAPAAAELGAEALTAKNTLDSFLANYRAGDLVGHRRLDVSQVQATATKVFGPTLGADAWVFVTEAAVMHVHDLPDPDLDPLDSPAVTGRTDLEDTSGDTTATSWGYRMAARLDYNNAIGAVNLYPYLQFQHDVSGNSPAPIGPFAEGRTALTLGLRADYLSRWQAEVGYTQYDGRRHWHKDRDFISASIKYSF
jgi:hypothetical protein